MRGTASVGVRITDRRNGNVVCAEGTVADTFMKRLVGLLRHKTLADEAGLLIVPCSGVHTFWMSFAIDVVTLDKQRRVVAVFEDVRPGRMCGLSFKARSVLELAAGRARACGIQAGDQLVVEAC